MVSGDVAVPVVVAAQTGRRSVRLVWRNECGGLTFELGLGSARSFIKWAPVDSGIDLAVEVDRLRWAASYAPVPRVLRSGGDETGTWMVTAPLPGDSAVSPRWRSDPATSVTAIGSGLRALHDAFPVERCPFSWSVSDRLALARKRAATGLLVPGQWHAEFQSLTVPRAMRLLDDIPPVDRLVVCHGDACAPNTLLTVDGRCCGHVDFGALGVADRWADLAIATWSTQWNYGPGWEGLLLAAYGIDRDLGRTAYYRLLWDLT